MKSKLLLLFLLIAAIAFFQFCHDEQSFKSQASKDGFELAKKNCATCHQLPKPNAVDKQTWANYVLPKMSGYFGFNYMQGGSYFENGKHAETMPLNEWRKILTYYISEAPETLEPKKIGQHVKMGLPFFSVDTSAFHIATPVTTFARAAKQHGQLIFADGQTEQVYKLSRSLQLVDSIAIGTGVVHVRSTESATWYLSMGVLYPSDESAGKLVIKEKGSKMTHTILDSLQRPVHIEYADLDGDRLEDIILCEFGNTAGKFSWLKNTGNNTYQQKVLRGLPGAIRSEVIDADSDGLLDLVVLMAQGDEGIFIYYNKGNGNFQEQRVLQFSPSFGSNYFELADVNNDGFPDVLATNGDNGDYPAILKPYHGIRIYMNDGKYNFKESIFLPVNGSSKAIARDFDRDGDLDIASIAYFPDYDNTPQESFIYWENKGDLKFSPYSFSQATAGRWLTLEADDIDDDGDLDIVLGNAKFSFGYVPKSLMKKWVQYAPSVLILRNNQ